VKYNGAKSVMLTHQTPPVAQNVSTIHAT